MSNETLNFTIDKKKIKDEVVFQNKKEGFIPYNNFESSVNWKVIS